jgi:DNA-binding transcriptional ArsR family regulator
LPLMTVQVDITDPKLVRAYAHPLRISILGLLDNRVASPSEIAAELDTPLPNTAYHVRQLAALGFIKLVGRRVRGGAVEHRYTATVRPFVSDEVDASLPDIVRRAISSGVLEQAISQMLQSHEQGGYLRARAHNSRSAGRVDEQGWNELADVLNDALARVEQAIKDSEARVAADPDAAAETATVFLSLFEGPKPKAVGEREAGGTGSARGKRKAKAKAKR